jgi:hypothetical protein
MAIVGFCAQIADSRFNVDVPHGLVSFVGSGPDSAWSWEQIMAAMRKNSVRSPGCGAAKRAKNAQKRADDHPEG